MLRRFFFCRIACGKFSFIAISQERRAIFCAPLLSFPNRAAYCSVFFFPAAWVSEVIFLCVSKIFSIRRQAKFFCLPPLPYESSAGGSPLIKFARTASRFCVAEKPFFCKLYSRSPAFCTAAVLSRPNVGRSKIFCSSTFGPIHKSSRAVSARLSLFTSFYAPLSGNYIHIHHAP